MDYKNFREFCEKFNRLRNAPDTWSLEDRQFMEFWLVELSMALMRDFDNKDLSKDVAKTMEFLCEQC